MANALIYGTSGSGKTVNSTLVHGKSILVNTDNSSIVLGNFKRPDLDIVNVSTSADFLAAYHSAYTSGKYTNIIVDNLSDLFDMWILEIEASGKFADPRRSYLVVYQALKRLVRESTAVKMNTIFTAWLDVVAIPQTDGTVINRQQPKIPAKILDNVCGLCNIVGMVTNSIGKDNQQHWYYITQSSPALYAKDQMYCRNIVMPEMLFEKEKKEGK